MNKYIIGTAGHVDHGKTTLIRNLTGTDTDTLKEEKKRGLTIDIGFAFLNENISFIDVPGHEKFIKNMVAGAATINFAMLVIAADDGIMPQTIEHFDIMNFMGIQNGIIVLTKTDLVNEDVLTKRLEEISTFTHNNFLKNAPIFPVTSTFDEQMVKLKTYLENLPHFDQKLSKYNLFRMPIDRAFSVKGFGDIITGTIISGNLKKDKKDLILYPEKIPVTIRSIETQNNQVNKIFVNQRCALNIKSQKKLNLYRGQFLSEKDVFITTQIITATFTKADAINEIKYGERIRFYVNTAEYFARIRIIGENTISNQDLKIVQFDFDKAISVGFHDRYIIRKLSPMITVGGGKILDPNPPKIKKSNLQIIPKYLNLQKYNISSNICSILTLYGYLNFEKLCYKISLPKLLVQPIIHELILQKKIISCGQFLFSIKHFNSQENKILQSLNQENKIFKGIKKTEIIKICNLDATAAAEILDYLIHNNIIESQDDFLFLANQKPTETGNIKNVQLLQNQLNNNQFKLQNFKQLQETLDFIKSDLEDALNYLKLQNEVKILDNGYIISQKSLMKAETIFKNYLSEKQYATVTELKQLLHTTRRYILPILKYFDKKLLVRDGDFRRLK